MERRFVDTESTIKSLVDYTRKQVSDSIDVKVQIMNDNSLLLKVVAAATECIEALQRGNKIIFAGNGGSAADAQHLAGELVSRFYFDRPALAGIALTVDTSVLTAIGNDYGYEHVFSRQLKGLGKEGDVFIAISTSGNSPNIIRGIKIAKELGLKVIGLTGSTGGKMADVCDIILKVPSDETPRIQESHILIGHIICAIIEKKLFGGAE